MSTQTQTKNINQDIERELARCLSQAQAENRPAEIVLAGKVYRLVPVGDVRTTEDPARDYDPARMLASLETLRASGGVLQGLDIEAFLEEIMEMREQDTPGHRWP